MQNIPAGSVSRRPPSLNLIRVKTFLPIGFPASAGMLAILPFNLANSPLLYTIAIFTERILLEIKIFPNLSRSFYFLGKGCTCILLTTA